MTEGAHVLVVDDDGRLRTLLRRFLAEHGFRVTTAENAAEARQQLGAVQPDALVLDVAMPGEDGVALTRALRGAGGFTAPILLLTARGEPEDQIEGFEAGADDYLGKPFDPRVLLMRLRALLRRIAPPQPTENDRPVRLGALEFDPVTGRLSGADGLVHLTGGEAALLAVLARRPGEVFARDELARTLEMDEASERAIDVGVTRLRRKIEPDTREPRFLQTVRSRGYVLKPG